MLVLRRLLIFCSMLPAAVLLRADSAFRLQRLNTSDDSASYAGALDAAKTQPLKTVNLKLPNGMVQPMDMMQAAELDIEPLYELGEQRPERRDELEKFARKTLVPFLRLLRKPKGAVAAGERVAKAAARLFPGSDVPAALEELAQASDDPEGNEAKIRGCASRLNAAFHPAGMHLTFGRFVEFDGGTVELSVYGVTQRLLAQINDRTVPVYILKPYDDVFRVLALGMMEPYPPRIFIFGDMVALHAQDINTFLRNLKDYPFEDPAIPDASIPKAVQVKINQIVRQQLRTAVGGDPHAVERWLLSSVARHEGQHLYIDRSLKEAAESRKIEWDDFNRYHERQAYLFELETSEPEFTPFVLLASFSISAALSDKYSRVGCGTALRGLQKQLPSVKFWDSDFNRPIADGLIPLFQRPPREILDAAASARREVERFLTSSEGGPSEGTKAGR